MKNKLVNMIGSFFRKGGRLSYDKKMNEELASFVPQFLIHNFQFQFITCR